MSETDSFIDEVTEEVRRDRLFAMFRKHGWIGLLLVLFIVGGSAWNEWKKARAEADAESFGDALLAAEAQGDAAARLEALRALGENPAAFPQDGQKMLLAFLTAAEAEAAGDLDGARAILSGLTEGKGLPGVYQDLALLRLVSLGWGQDDPAARAEALARLTTPGAPFRTLAQEQEVYGMLEAGETDAAIARLQEIRLDAETPAGQQARIGDLLTLLGVDKTEQDPIPQPLLGGETAE
ncbi:MAG: tetratricopeptide repeat protein [Paracoccaceae bacterium]